MIFGLARHDSIRLGTFWNFASERGRSGEVNLAARNRDANPGARAGIDLNVLDAHFHFHRSPISVAQCLASQMLDNLRSTDS